ncbi:hypothetical protein M8756_15555 [Lutimaribacter sp. EGI FJ00015]|uniref:Uncharacterized protein n=1 Tax=Lutimaribacter degradans TaxID=2945989 RepID=A0ACC6A0K1_9RHOB|nr:hypothetical protein [Lutimaribacter sp. EGI FJ00013]MCM2563600.1 hypothetical protein [Lutimaribacter sp. EGI FJ00013]MCO0614736.1 hypothetical protein [Lutimaribacter sp. EGI FJ00015]MCO0637406.1 hypothetical protein [Lutimaribacter sp. EGI FJ00014]
MLKSIEIFQTDPNDWEFLALTQSMKVYSEGFSIRDVLSVKFDNASGGQVGVSANKPEVNDPYYRLCPIKMGGASWYSIEYEVPGAALSNVDQIIPCLDAASLKSVALFAVLRIFYENGRSEDISSAQIELRRDRRRQSFPISLGDIPARADQVKAVRVIFFVEARDVDIDIYGLTMATIEAAKTPDSIDTITRLRKAHQGGARSMQLLHLDAAKDAWTGTAQKHRPIKKSIFLDFQPGEDRQMKVAQKRGCLAVDFAKTASGGWRNLEFRFKRVRNTGTIMAALYAKGRATPELEANLVLRSYDKKMNIEDTPIPVSVPLFPKDGSLLRMIDLSPLLTDKWHVHHFGIMVFLPPEAKVLEIEEMDVFIFDREVI